MSTPTPPEKASTPEKPSRATAHFVADEIHEASERTASQLSRPYEQTMELLKDQLKSAERLGRMFMGLFALSLVINLVLVTLLLQGSVELDENGVKINSTAPENTDAHPTE